MTTTEKRKDGHGWLPPRSGGYIPGEGRSGRRHFQPQPPKSPGGVGNLRARQPDEADRRP